MNAFITVALVALFAQFGTCDDAADKDAAELLEKRGGKINYRRLARGLHMLRLGKRGAPQDKMADYGFDDGDTLLPYENYEEYLPLGEQYELPVSSSETDSDNFYGPEEGGIEEGLAKRPMNMLRLGKRPIDMLRLGKRPMSMLRLGKRPMSMLRLGKRPMSMLRLGKRPMSMLRLGKRRLSMLRLGKRPMSMLRLGKRPSDSEDLEKRPMSMLRLGKRSQSA